MSANEKKIYICAYTCAVPNGVECYFFDISDITKLHSLEKFNAAHKVYKNIANELCISTRFFSITNVFSGLSGFPELPHKIEYSVETLFFFLLS